MSLIRHDRRHRVRDLAAYVLIGLGILATGLVYAVYEADHGRTAGVPLKWLGLAVNTPAVFWFGLRPFRRYWHRAAVRLALATMLAVHLAVFTIVLTRVGNWPLLWYIPADFFETVVILTVLGRLVDQRP